MFLTSFLKPPLPIPKCYVPALPGHVVVVYISDDHWVKDDKFGKNIKDEEGYTSFALVNKATGQALKHSIGVTYPVQLVDYNPGKLDKTVLWTMGRNLGDGYRAIRAVDNIHLNLDAYEGIPKLGGVHDGTHIVLWDWFGNDKQKWTIVAYYGKMVFYEGLNTFYNVRI
ncbi:Ricin B lectin domain-containing protein [Artemisia annua]|uniref:Ricin B lectin domain-containing protein n=1 Tax=Artemisia annua TaxID=35608 RepID=A0A2U1M772_ARTAN|nr:Ricin B lectin domain-containing protein [Artemisia annua]